MKEYDLFDIVIFGSYVKNKEFPADIDLAILHESKSSEILSKVRIEINKRINKTSLEFLELNSLYTNPLWISLQREGFSIRENKFLSDILGLEPYVIFIYNLQELVAWKKVNFSKVLNSYIDKYKGIKLGRGAVLVPRKYSSYFDEFLNSLNITYQVKWVDLVE